MTNHVPFFSVQRWPTGLSIYLVTITHSIVLYLTLTDFTSLNTPVMKMVYFVTFCRVSVKEVLYDEWVVKGRGGRVGLTRELYLYLVSFPYCWPFTSLVEVDLDSVTVVRPLVGFLTSLVVRNFLPEKPVSRFSHFLAPPSLYYDLLPFVLSSYILFSSPILSLIILFPIKIIFFH